MAAQDKIEVTRQQIKKALKFPGLDEIKSMDELCEKLKNWDNSEKSKYLNQLLNEIRIQRGDARTYQAKIDLLNQKCILEGEKTEQPHSDPKPAKKAAAPRKSVDTLKVKDSKKQTLEKVREEYHNKSNAFTMVTEDQYDKTSEWKLYKNSIVSQQNKWIIEFTDDMELNEKQILLFSKDASEIIALGCLEKIENNKYYALFPEQENIDYKGIQDGLNKFKLVFFDKNQENKTYRMDDVEIYYSDYEWEKDRPLCIDFGTSNTTAGSYGIRDAVADEIEIVEFIDVTQTPNRKDAKLLPTLVYVENCEKKDAIKFLFGYEAKKKIEEMHYECKADSFYELKRWISAMDQEELITDGVHQVSVKRSAIIKAYLDYVIEQSERFFQKKFKKLHFSAPVKLKQKFLEEIKKLYNDQGREILEDKEAIDEGISIVYGEIAQLIHQKGINVKDDSLKNKSIMIMDCGGGTTDLASCKYKVESVDGVKAGRIKLDTQFINGNSNFGGNNITYRIMQILKIKMAAAICPDEFENGGNIFELIDKDENEILDIMESSSSSKQYNSEQVNEVYARFQENYEKAEKIIPTCYSDDYMEKAKLKVKRNFHYLWHKAEEIKIEFFKSDSRISISFGNKSDKDYDSQITISDQDNYFIYKKTDSRLERQDAPMKDISITFKEINRVICGDIYGLLCGLLENDQLKDQEMKVEDYDYYKLSGQSCKISLFTSLLKEYIPGKKLRAARREKSNENTESEKLKLECVRGSIKFMQDCRRGEIQPVIIPNPPKVIYDVLYKREYEETRLYDHTEENEIKVIEILSNAEEFKFSVLNSHGIEERSFMLKLGSAKEEQRTTEQIKDVLLKQAKASEETIIKFIDTIEGIDLSNKPGTETRILFGVPSKDGYGIRIGVLKKSREGENNDDVYTWLEWKYENFEDASKSFFDGKH